MKKAFSFLESLTPTFLEVFGHPTIKFYDDFVEVYFDSSNTFRSLDYFDLSGYDEFRFFANDGVITFVWTFYK